ncbi:DUF3486 family protein [Mesorhizobium australicum]|uniref:DUF3486 family protein n=1 Tax=Mesorhizobium australicum TaxID=536018 RepID=A0A1X7NX94_9HYPH|nr:DUF3486 family protein [Mesorhizobium australicum]SMH42371.1 Protein of unknown function [Mesorhizobium australicum]
MAKRSGRGRLSGMEQLPEEASPIIAAAAEALRDRDRTQLDIYEEFFNALNALKREHRGELEFAIPSFSAFNRYSIKLATLTRRLEETREIAAAISKRFDAEASDDLTLIAAESIKNLIFEMIIAKGEAGIDPKGAMNLANALRAAAQAQGVSTARRIKVEKEFEEGVEAAVETVVREKGMTAETAEAIKAKILGVRKT